MKIPKRTYKRSWRPPDIWEYGKALQDQGYMPWGIENWFYKRHMGVVDDLQWVNYADGWVETHGWITTRGLAKLKRLAQKLKRDSAPYIRAKYVMCSKVEAIRHKLGKHDECTIPEVRAARKAQKADDELQRLYRKYVHLVDALNRIHLADSKGDEDSSDDQLEAILNFLWEANKTRLGAYHERRGRKRDPDVDRKRRQAKILLAKYKESNKRMMKPLTRSEIIEKIADELHLSIDRVKDLLYRY